MSLQVEYGAPTYRMARKKEVILNYGSVKRIAMEI
jgi:hypothetical protein